MKWVTRGNLGGIDTTACPWLIKKFIDPKAVFFFTTEDKVAEVATKEGGIPFDAEGVELVPKEGQMMFQTLLEEYGVDDPVLFELAKIVHHMPDVPVAPERAGVGAIVGGARYWLDDDFQRVEMASKVYEALYCYCKAKLLQDKYKDELATMNRSQVREFLNGKMQEQL